MVSSQASLLPKTVLDRYCTDPAHCTAIPLGGGKINLTYRVVDCGKPFILQRIGRNVFPEPERVVENYRQIWAHLHAKKRQVGNGEVPALPAPKPTLDSSLLCRDGHGEVWRALEYFAHTPHGELKKLKYHEIGHLLGRFHTHLSDLDCSLLHDPLPGFHDLEGYLAGFESARKGLSGQLSAELLYALAEVEKWYPRVEDFITRKRSGGLEIQPVHGDPKLENFLFDSDGSPLALIDLDTVGPGSIGYDLGDCFRSFCSRPSAVPGKADFDTEICRQIARGYRSATVGWKVTEQDQMLYDALLAVSFELAVRYLTDHLMGNVYFRISRPGENLANALYQFSLAEAIHSREKELRNILDSVSG